MNIYNASLVLHIVGISVMAGTTFIDFITFEQFWKVFFSDTEKGLLIEGSLNKFQKFMGLGLLFIIISGVIMMVFLHGVWGQQIWFRVKMGLLLLIIINGLGFRRRLGTKLKKLLAEISSDHSFVEKLVNLKANIRTVHLLQLVLFVAIFTLSIFKFN